MEKSDCCEKWNRRYLSKTKRLSVALASIPEIYNKIAVIEQILKEDAPDDTEE